MYKKTITVLMFLCFFFLIAGCKIAENEIKAIQAGQLSPQSESAEIKALKKSAGIPEEAKIENVSMYGGEIPKLVVYSIDNQTEIKRFDKNGSVTKTEELFPESYNTNSVIMDEAGNVNAYITKDENKQQGKVVLIDKNGGIEKEIPLINEEIISGDIVKSKEYEEITLSGNGQYMLKSHVKAGETTESRKYGELARTINVLEYSDRNGKILWHINCGFYGFREPKISYDGDKILLYKEFDSEGDSLDVLRRGIYVFDRNGIKLYSYNFTDPNITMASWNNAILYENGDAAIIPINDRSNGKFIKKYLHILVNEDRSFISESINK